MMTSVDDGVAVSDDARARMVAAAGELEEKWGVKILWLVESGSRAWEMHSPDSDYDGRGVFVPTRRQPLSDALAALGLMDGRETHDITWFSEDRQYDINLWSLDKLIRHLGEGKSISLEWMRSPIVYMNTGGWLERMREATQCGGAAGGRGASMAQFVGQLSTALHQNARDQRCDAASVRAAHTAADEGVAMLQRYKLACLSGDDDSKADARAGVLNTLESIEKVAAVAASAPVAPSLTAKKLAYVLRPALYLAWMAQHADGLPPIGVQTTLSQVELPDDLAARIGAVLAAKRCAAEKAIWHGCDEVLDTWVLAQRRWAISSGDMRRYGPRDLLALVELRQDALRWADGGKIAEANAGSGPG